MTLSTRLRTWAVGTTQTAAMPKVALAEAGHALLLHIEGRLDTRALAFARMIARDPERTVVVADLPPHGPIELWHAVVALLGRRRGGYRLVLGTHSRDAAVMTGQWLAERLGCPVLVSDGDVVMGPGGTLFSSALPGVGWVRLRRGRPPRRDSRRFPVPDWTFPGTEQIWQPGPVSVVEPLPAGVWIRPLEAADDQRHLLISSMAFRKDLLTVVLGSPNARPVPLAEIARFCHSVPAHARDRMRFVQYGQVEVLRSSAGQALADQLGEPVTFYAGMPSPEGTLHVTGPDGKPAWRSYARELRYQPRVAGPGPMPPQLLAYDSPVSGAAELSPGVYWYAADAVVEVVQSGLWLRPPVDPVNADDVRAAPIDPRYATVMYDTTSRHLTRRMHNLAGEFVAKLDPAMRRMFRVLPAVFAAPRKHVPMLSPASGVLETVPDRCAPTDSPAHDSVELIAPEPRLLALPPAAAESSAPVEATVVVPVDVIEDATAGEQRTVAAPVGGPPVTGEPVVPIESVVDAEPVAMLAGLLRLESSVPDFAAIAAPAMLPDAEPQTQSTQDDLAVEPEPESVAVAAGTQVRVQPVPVAAACAVPPARGLAEERAWLRKTLSSQYDVAASTMSRMLSQVPGLRAGIDADEVLADLVAVRLYLTGDSAGVDNAVRSAAPGPHVPLARCVSTGLKRLPSHRGATQLWAPAGQSELDWYRDRLLISEWAFLTATTSGRPARRGEVEFRIWSMTARRTELIDPSVPDQVLFVPGTSFKVLQVRDEPTPVVLLRELSSAEIGEDGEVSTSRGVFDDLALGSLGRAAQAWAQSTDADAARPTASAPPGLYSAALEGAST